jgi:hypothetical protein
MGLSHCDRIPTAEYMIGFNTVTCVCVCMRARAIKHNLANNSGGPKSNMVIRNCNLRKRQVRKRGTIGFNQPPSLNLTFYLPLLNSVAKENYSNV